MPELFAPTDSHCLPGSAAPAASSESPLEMLAAWRDRIEALCGSLMHLAVHQRSHVAAQPL